MGQPLVDTPKMSHFMYTKKGLWVLRWRGAGCMSTPKISEVQRGSPLSKVVTLCHFGVQG
jgi:hypothetical protein